MIAWRRVTTNVAKSKLRLIIKLGRKRQAYVFSFQFSQYVAEILKSRAMEIVGMGIRLIILRLNVRAGRPLDDDGVFCHGNINARCEHGEFAWSTKGSSQVGLNITPRRGVHPQRREGGRPRSGKL
jgi:hypothetical protein